MQRFPRNRRISRACKIFIANPRARLVKPSYYYRPLILLLLGFVRGRPCVTIEKKKTKTPENERNESRGRVSRDSIVSRFLASGPLSGSIHVRDTNVTVRWSLFRAHFGS